MWLLKELEWCCCCLGNGGRILRRGPLNQRRNEGSSHFGRMGSSCWKRVKGGGGRRVGRGLRGREEELENEVQGKEEVVGGWPMGEW